MRLERGGKLRRPEFSLVLPHHFSRSAHHNGRRPVLDSEQAIRGLDPRKLLWREHDKDGSRGVGALALAQGMCEEFQISGRLLVWEMDDEVGIAHSARRKPRRRMSGHLQRPRGREPSQSHIRKPPYPANHTYLERAPLAARGAYRLRGGRTR